MKSSHLNAEDSFWCALAVCAAALATLPWANVGMDDDWSFAHTALDAARSGRLLYYYWSEPIIGFQAYWAALFIRIFGFSFTLVRLSTLPLAMGSAAMLYGLARYAGLVRGLAFLATLSVMLSPLVIPLSVSFMTEIPALFFLLAVVYSGVRALDHPDRRGCFWWLLAATVAGFLGGTIRQPNWGLPLLVLPVIAYLRRRERSVVLMSAGMWAALLAAAGATFRWFQAQPYILDPTSRVHLANLTEHFPRSLAINILSLFLYVLPAWLGYTYFVPEMWRRKRILILAAISFGALYLSHLDRAPWVGNIVTHWGVLDATTDIIGTKPRLFSRETEKWLALLTFAGFSLSLALFVDRLRSGWEETRVLRLAALTLPYAVVYLLLIIARSGTDPYDRYLIPLLPILSIALLLQFQNRRGEAVPALGWIALALYGAYGICTTHDALAMRRAIARAADAIMATGVPRDCISGGFEFDGWTQIEEGRYVGYQPPAKPDVPIEFWFWKSTPKVNPHFILTLSRQPELAGSDFPPVRYMGWFPSGERQVWTEVAPECDCPGLKIQKR